VARNLHMGDYTNLSIKLDIHLDGQGGPNPPGGTGLPTILPTDLPTILPTLPTGAISSAISQITSGIPLPTLTGLPRPATGDSPSTTQGPTMRDLLAVYDADLVSLMIPTLVVS